MKKASFTRPLSVSFTKEVFQRIKAITVKHRISMAEWVRIAVEKELAENFKRERGDK